jgi:hypothetical protein
VWPVPVVVAAADSEDVLEMAGAEDEDSVETISAESADPALGVSVRVRRLDRRADHPDALRPEDTQLDALSIEASCRGGGAVYELGHNGADWWCSCLALGRCTHLVALQLVAVRDGRPHSLQTTSGVLNSQSRSSRAARSRAE